MHIRSGRAYNPEKPKTDMGPNASSYGITSSADYLTSEILRVLEKIKAQMNTLGQRMDRLEVKRHDGGHNKERQLNNAERRESTRITIDTMRTNGT